MYFYNRDDSVKYFHQLKDAMKRINKTLQANDKVLSGINK